jgi:hypothetical protein
MRGTTFGVLPQIKCEKEITCSDIYTNKEVINIVCGTYINNKGKICIYDGIKIK